MTSTRLFGVVSLLCAASCLPYSAVQAWQQLEVAAMVSFLEGPTADTAGNVYFSDIVSQRIMKLSLTGELSTFREKSNVANGLLIDREGQLIACEGADFERPGVKLKGTPRVTRTNLQTRAVEVLAGPDGTRYLCRVKTDLGLCRIDSEEFRPIPFKGQLTPIGWATDGSAIIAHRPDGGGRLIFRIDVKTGATSDMRRLGVEDATGLVAIGSPAITDDGEVYAYPVMRHFSQLYVIHGIN